ncbi:MAG TPA: Ig-like domain-containing protein [Allosphingosinicella sp.]
MTTINGGNGSDLINGMASDDDLDGGNGNDVIYGGDGNDIIDGGNGEDTLYGGAGDDIIHGNNGIDSLDGGAGNDQLFGDNGNDHIKGGAGDDLIDGMLGFDTAYYSGNIDEYTFFSAAGYLHVLHLGGIGADGHDRLRRIERIVFADRIIDLTGATNNRPVAVDDVVLIDEDTGTYSSGSASVLDNDFDFEGQALTVTGGTFTGAYGTLTINSDGTYSYVEFASNQALAQGQNVQDSFDYTVSDGSGTDTGALIFNIAGVNDAPTADPDSGTTGENSALTVDVLANDGDVDNGAVLTVTAASAPSGQGSASIVGNSVQFDPGTDFDDLAEGATEEVAVSYTVSDEHGATASSTVTIIVTGINDAPVANDDTASMGENGAPILVDVLANDTDADNGAVVTLTGASAPTGQGTASVVGGQVRFDPGTDFDDLGAGETEEVIVTYDIEDEHGATDSGTLTIIVTGANDGPVANPDTDSTHEDVAVTVDVLANDTDADDNAVLTVVAATVTPGEGSVSIVGNQVRYDPSPDLDYLADGETLDVVINYTIEDEHGVQSSSTVTITVQGETDGSITGTDDGETITGTPEDDRINALGGDDTVFALAGNDFVRGGGGADTLYGEGGNDTIEGGNDDDSAFGGDGFDLLDGEAGNDSLQGGNDGDVLSGGEGADDLMGQAGDDVARGDGGDDQVSGGDGNDDVNGDAGDDTVTGGLGDDLVKGGDGNDSMAGGDGNDELTDLAGTNSFDGGAGNDNIQAGSADGAQTIDGGGGNDTIRHYYRYGASVITTGAGSDTIEIANADQGTEAITVTDFTAGSGGDLFRLDGDDGALLGLLIGWDGSSNPFGSGFLRLVQEGGDTLLQWDRNGATDGAEWETLAVFQNSDAGDFTDANFSPGYHPNGSAPAGQNINGTSGSETLNGTIGDDTINAMGGNDTVNGGAGADTINGGDGADQLNGQADNDMIDGGNDDDIIFGGDGNDTAFGQAGADTLFGGLGDDDLFGGIGDDSLNGGEGDDSLEGGDGNDILTDDTGTNSLSGGLGNDQITARSTDGAQTISGGDGNDTIRHYYRLNASTIATGAGIDTIEIAFADQGEEAIIVTDFTPGAGGDVFRLTGEEGALLSLLVGWDGTSNPFGTFLRLHQEGANVQLEWDQDGAGEGADWQTLVIFENTDFDDFTEENFDPPYPPGGGAPPGETITGTADDDTLVGTLGADTINALGGSDSVFGLDGGDTINAGDGFDNVYGGGGDDIIDGGNDDDVLTGEDGNDQLLGQGGNDQLFGENGDDQLTGGGGLDSLAGDSGEDVLSGGDDADILSGGADDDSLNGGAGDDLLTGGSGSDLITGGLGFDVFSFQSAADGPDQVTDFVSVSDQIQVSADGFGGGLVAGGPVSFVSGSDPTATGTEGQFLYDTDDGRLLWDVDGTGAEDAVLIATFSSIPALDAADFIVV